MKSDIAALQKAYEIRLIGFWKRWTQYLLIILLNLKEIILYLLEKR
jgi:hypothetical protein